MPRSAPLFLFAALLAGAGAHAAELGEVRLGSHIGQQLVADIELLAIENPGAAVQVRLASSDVYRGASLDFPAVLGSLNLSVMRRDGRQFLHLTTLRPVTTDHLHLFLELVDGGRSEVRQMTLWLTPDPAPPAAPLPAPVPVAATPAREPSAEPQAVDQWPTPSPSPLPLPLARPAASRPPACVRPATPRPGTACMVLDAKNALLREEVVKLEDRVKLLQTALAPAPSGAPAHAAPPPAPTADSAHAAPPPADAAAHAAPPPPAHGEAAAPAVAAPAPAPAPAPGHAQPVKPAKPAAHGAKPAHGKDEDDEGGMPWGWILGFGALVFAGVGAATFFLRRRRAKAAPAKDDKASGKADKAPPQPAEPTLDEGPGIVATKLD